jgi:hypothetical protein
MALTHKVGQTYSSDAGTIAAITDTFTGDGEVNFDGSIPISTNHEVDIAFANADVVSLLFYSDKAVTIKTNSTGSPDTTIALAEKTMLTWNATHLEANPFVAADVTKLYITNATSAAANMKIRILVNV